MVSCISTLSYGIVIGESPIIVSSISILISTMFLGYAKWVLYVNDTSKNIDNMREESRPIKPYDYESIV